MTLNTFTCALEMQQYLNSIFNAILNYSQLYSAKSLIHSRQHVNPSKFGWNGYRNAEKRKKLSSSFLPSRRLHPNKWIERATISYPPYSSSNSSLPLEPKSEIKEKHDKKRYVHGQVKYVHKKVLCKSQRKT